MEPKDHFQSVSDPWHFNTALSPGPKSTFLCPPGSMTIFSYPLLTFLDVIMFFIVSSIWNLGAFHGLWFLPPVLCWRSFPSPRGHWPGPPTGDLQTLPRSGYFKNSPWNRRAGSIHFNLLQYLTLLTTPSLKPSSTLASLIHIFPGSFPTLVVHSLHLPWQLHQYLSLEFRLFFLALFPSVIIYSIYSPHVNNPIAMSLALESGPSSWALAICF